MKSILATAAALALIVPASVVFSPVLAQGAGCQMVFNDGTRDTTSGGSMSIRLWGCWDANGNLVPGSAYADVTVTADSGAR